MVDTELNIGLIPDYRHSYIFTTIGLLGKQMSATTSLVQKITVKNSSTKHSNTMFLNLFVN